MYLQDKIQISKKFVLTPGLIYTHYANGTYNGNNVQGSSRLTASLYSSYDFDNATNAYVSASQIFKPVTGLDRNRQYANDVLEDETGWSYNAGISRKFSPRDYGEINFGLTDMDNAVGRYSIYNELTSKWQTRAVNASRLKRSMNVGYTHDFDDVMEKYDAMMDWLAELYVNTLNVIHYMHDKYSYESLQMALHDRDVFRTMACGIAGLSVCADSLSAIKYAKVKPIRNEEGIAVDFEVEGECGVGTARARARGKIQRRG